MKYGDLTSPDIRRFADEGVAILPIAAIEQHGDHLPVITDTAIADELAARVEQRFPTKVALLPTLWAGCSDHHLGFPGTLSIGSDTYIRVLCDLVNSLIGTGFRRIVLLNAHGGNQTPAAEALYRLDLEHQGESAPWIACVTYWKTAARELAALVGPTMETAALSHACEYETSIMLALRADCVKLEQARGAEPSRESAFYDPLGYTPSRVQICESFHALSPHGALGSPELATPEKGAVLLDTITGAVGDFVGEFAEWPLRPARQSLE